MDIKNTTLAGCFEIVPKIIEDDRGRFVKPWHIDELKACGLYYDVLEEYYSISKKDVIRGMHFQTPPKATKKLVTCLNGSVWDVVIDLRKSSATYNQHFEVELSASKGNMLYIPEGFAHGFCVLSEEATMLYLCSEMHSPENDAGIHWNSAGIQWPIDRPVVSAKDDQLTPLKQFENPF